LHRDDAISFSTAAIMAGIVRLDGPEPWIVAELNRSDLGKGPERPRARRYSSASVPAIG